MTEDQILVSRVIRGDLGSFRLLIKKHQRLVAHMVARLIDNNEDREEICQDVFIKVHEKLKEFSFNSRLSTWIATIAYRHAVNHLRKQKIRINDIPDEEHFTSHFIAGDNPGEDLEDQDLNALAMKFINQLPVQYKTVLTLYHLEGMTYPEIGEATGMPEGTVKSYLFRARATVKEGIKKYIGKEELL